MTFPCLFSANCHLLFSLPILSFVSHLSQFPTMFSQIFLCPWIYFHMRFHQFFFLDPFIYSVSEVTIVSCLFNSVCNQAASTVSSMASFLTPPQPLNTCPCCPGTWPDSYFSFGRCCLYFFILDVFLCFVLCQTHSLYSFFLAQSPIGLSSSLSPYTALVFHLCIVPFYHKVGDIRLVQNIHIFLAYYTELHPRQPSAHHVVCEVVTSLKISPN